MEERWCFLLERRVRLDRDCGRPREVFEDASLSQRRSLSNQHKHKYGDAGQIYRESNLSMSACEYEAPMIFLFSYGLEVLEAVRQKGDADLRSQR